MPRELTRAERRNNRGLVLAALVQETGSRGGKPAQDAVNAVIGNPEGVSKEQWSFVGALPLSRFYVSPGRPTRPEQESLWQRLRAAFDVPATADCPPMRPDLTVGLLQAMIEEAAG